MALSNYAANEINDHKLKGLTWTAPATVYLALFSTNPTAAGTGTELTVANGYIRQAITFGASSGRASANTAAVVFTNTGADWSAATHGAFFDAESGGNMLEYGALAASRTVLASNTLTFAIGDITSTFS